MLRKLFWLITILALIGTFTGIADRRQAERRRELWAEATDPR
ncbi:hypothetical protein [Tessaracoccus flavus]|jgi:hypothetical protein|nr:hypothetical protein [Tessaracoccus flavus]